MSDPAPPDAVVGHRSNSALTFVAFAVLASLLAAIFFRSVNFNDPIPGGDYIHFYLPGRMFRDGGRDRLYDFDYQYRFQHDPAAMPFPPNPKEMAYCVYPPFFVWYCLPFSYLPFKAGAMAWDLLMSAFLVASVYLLVRAKDSRAFGPALLASVVFTPTFLTLYSCQNSPMTLLILSGTYALLRSGRPTVAGLAFALVAYKPQMAMVLSIAMVLKGQWRFVLGGALGGLALLAASLAVSPASTAAYLRIGPKLYELYGQEGVTTIVDECSWRGFWRMILGSRPGSGSETATALCGLATMALLARVWWARIVPSSDTFSRPFSAAVVATILLSPHILIYDLTLLLIPLILVASPLPKFPAGLAPSEVRPLGRPLDPGGFPMRVGLYGVASLTRSIAIATRFQVAVPAMMLYLFALSQPIRDRPASERIGALEDHSEAIAGDGFDCPS